MSIEWRENERGNFWRHVDEGEGVTVFAWGQLWKWVYQGEFSEEEYPSATEAMDAAEEALELDD